MRKFTVPQLLSQEPEDIQKIKNVFLKKAKLNFSNKEEFSMFRKYFLNRSDFSLYEKNKEEFADKTVINVSSPKSPRNKSKNEKNTNEKLLELIEKGKLKKQDLFFQYFLYNVIKRLNLKKSATDTRKMFDFQLNNEVKARRKISKIKSVLEHLEWEIIQTRMKMEEINKQLEKEKVTLNSVQDLKVMTLNILRKHTQELKGFNHIFSVFLILIFFKLF